MADELRIGFQELLRKASMEHDAYFLKEGVRVLSQALMEMEVEEYVGAARHPAKSMEIKNPAVPLSRFTPVTTLTR